MFIELSKKAESMIYQMILDTGITNMFLRVGIDDGGCSGISYSIKLDDMLTEEDSSMQTEKFKVIWDRPSEPFLDGTIIDYQEQGMIGGFTINNPNATATCGCGASFRTATFKGKRNKCD